MPRYTLLQSFTFLLLLGASAFVAHNVVRYLIKVDGGYSKWSEFTECSVSCGGGVRTRVRTCTLPSPKYGGLNCSVLGKPLQVYRCNLLPCPVHGGYSNWGEYGACSKTCGGGEQERHRGCDNPAPQFGGKNCREMELGDDLESRQCNTEPCPVDGKYSDWSPYSECSSSCGGGKRTRTRTCTNPKPEHGGKECEGPGEETEECNTDPCATSPPPDTTTAPAPTAAANRSTPPRTDSPLPSKDTTPTATSGNQPNTTADTPPETPPGTSPAITTTAPVLSEKKEDTKKKQ